MPGIALSPWAKIKDAEQHTIPQNLWSARRPLSQDCVGDRVPPRGIHTPHVDRKVLTSDQRGQRIEIHFVYAPIYDKVSHQAECDQKVHAEQKEAMVEQKIKA